MFTSSYKRALFGFFVFFIYEKENQTDRQNYDKTNANHGDEKAIIQHGFLHPLSFRIQLLHR